MNKKKMLFAGLLFLTIAWLMAGTALAGWVKDTSGSYRYVTKQGKTLPSVWYPEINGGIVKMGSYYYCYLLDGTRYQKGFLKFNEGSRYFNKSNGKMARGRIRTLNGKKYRFDAKGLRYEKKWVDKHYYGKWGTMAMNKWIGRRYVNSTGEYVTGLKKINKVLYYFKPSDGRKVTNTELTINGKKYTFDADGKGSLRDEPSVPVEDSWYTDPVVDNETLLAAIIYCEAGNQDYCGQVAVGLVITNRMRSSSFPNKMKEVIYAKTQFQPCRDGSLKRVLNNPALISETSRNAAKEVIRLYNANSYKLTLPDGKVTYLKDYYFFMTKAAYIRLGLKSKYRVLKDHVFFKTWER